jgi:hypothetical protein
MGRAAVDKLAASRIPAGHDGLWQVIRQLRRFSVVALQEYTGHRKDTVRDYVKRLERAGYLKLSDEQPLRRTSPTKIYELVKDMGQEAPRLRRDGSPARENLGNEQMWRTMKMLKRFTGRDLAIAASTDEHAVEESTARKYAQVLAKAGYLAIQTESAPGRQAVYRFVKSTGPKPPMIQRVKQVFDPNLRAVVWPAPKADLNMGKRGRR